MRTLLILALTLALLGLPLPALADWDFTFTAKTTGEAQAKLYDVRSRIWHSLGGPLIEYDENGVPIDAPDDPSVEQVVFNRFYEAMRFTLAFDVGSVPIGKLIQVSSQGSAGSLVFTIKLIDGPPITP